MSEYPDVVPRPLPREEHETLSLDGGDVRAGGTARGLRVLVFTTVFPNSAQPTHGVFVRERILRLAEISDVRIVAPVPWLSSLCQRMATADSSGGLEIAHPRFWYVPRILKWLDGVLLFLSALGEIRRLRRRFDFDLLDAHFAYPDGFAAVLLGRWFRRPVCITLRGTIIPLSADPVRRRLCDWAIRRAARVIAVADNLAERALAGGVSPARLEIIANGVDADRFRPIDRDAARRALGIEQSGPLVLSVGHLSPRKGFQRVIAALPCILCAYPDAIVAIVGGPGAEGNNGSELRRKAADLGVAHRVIFVGPVPPERVALWLGAADVLALASAFEGCPNVVLEAMACGRPVVATRVGHVDAMVPSFAGVLFGASESDDALAQALLAALARSWDAQRIRDHASALSWESVAQRVAAQWRLAVSEAASCGTAAPSAVDAAGRRARKIALPFSASGIIKR